MRDSLPASPRVPVLLTAVTAALCFLLLLYIHLSAQSTIRKYVPWVDAAMEIKLEVAMAHLWFEELMSGDSNETIASVREHFKQAKWYATAVLDGGENQQGIFHPLQDDQLRTQVNQLLYQIQLFHKITEARYQHLGSSSPGSMLDTDFDAAFLRLIAATSLLEADLKQHIEQETQTQNTMTLLLFLAIATMSLISACAIWRFNSSRSSYLKQLARANQQISEQNEQLQQLAHRDQLTGLPNRKMLEILASNILCRVKRKHAVLSVTFIDLDFFKPINDQYGHSFGDEVLVCFTEAISSLLREEDVLARLAGDEFVLLMQARSEAELHQTLDRVMRRIDERLRLPVITQPHEVHLRCSAGTAIAPRDALCFDELLSCADHAMYESKRSGRGQHCYYEHCNTQAELPLSPESSALEASN